MIIDCPVCNKKFDIDQDLIPTDGRLLQCGSCNHKWFFKLNINEKKPEKEIKINYPLMKLIILNQIMIKYYEF